jgi:hypothetical protein
LSVEDLQIIREVIMMGGVDFPVRFRPAKVLWFT